jgi:ubiquinone/menaquinone biosynthesis C-methylase UbiE
VSFKELETAGWSEAGRADAYDRVVGRVTAHVSEPLLDAARAGPGTRLLDVATGSGHVAGAAAARGADAVGVDISEEMLARVRPQCDLLWPDAGAREQCAGVHRRSRAGRPLRWRATRTRE